MPPKKARHADRQATERCRRKNIYPSRKAAAGMARKVSQETDEHLHAYRCDVCRQWHIGHPSGTKRQAS